MSLDERCGLAGLACAELGRYSICVEAFRLVHGPLVELDLDLLWHMNLNLVRDFGDDAALFIAHLCGGRA